MRIKKTQTHHIRNTRERERERERREGDSIVVVE
jgi:hypothetical protein